jgi:hypothetical protein|tara:strand:+ start:158 stop:607 length:450 start_codon:yes stop_codon:yes gene_type:complete
MAHFAKLDENNIVTDVITFSNQEVIDNGGDLSVEAENFVSARHPGTWKQTSYNHTFRKKYAGIGDTYDPVKDKFITAQPYASWSLDADDEWQAPISRPNTKFFDDSTNVYMEKWKESTQEWIGILSTRYFTWDSNTLQWNENGLGEDWE